MFPMFKLIFNFSFPTFMRDPAAVFRRRRQQTPTSVLFSAAFFTKTKHEWTLRAQVREKYNAQEPVQLPLISWFFSCVASCNFYLNFILLEINWEGRRTNDLFTCSHFSFQSTKRSDYRCFYIGTFLQGKELTKTYIKAITDQRILFSTRLTSTVSFITGWRL